MKLKLILLAILGTAIGYWITNMFIQSMSFWQYLAIEFMITIMHALYNAAKKEAINT